MAFLAAICLIACHGAPADHFAVFAKKLSEEGREVEIYAAGPALTKFEQHGIKVTYPFNVEGISLEEEDTLAEQIAKACATASVVITDLGHPFDIKVQKALTDYAKDVTRWVYYENPEWYVPGGYSTTAGKVIPMAQGVLFANSNLAEAPLFEQPGKTIDFKNQKKIGIGYYPVDQAEKIEQRRSIERVSVRKAFLSKQGLSDIGQQILVYFGGNNEDYFLKAFPAFLHLLEEKMKPSEASRTLIVFQQHPGAKGKNRDGMLLHDWISTHKKGARVPKVIFSDLSSEEAQVMADGALYWQTSMGPQWILAGIPTMQVGHETFEDILVRNQWISSITKAEEWLSIVSHFSKQQKTISRDALLSGLGIRSNWFKALTQAIEDGI